MTERAEFEAWRTSDPRNAAAYQAAERMSEALAKLAMVDPRLKAMVDQAAGVGATLADDAPEDPPGKSPPLTITASATAPSARRRIARPFASAASIAATLVALLAVPPFGDSGAAPDDGYRHSRARPALRCSADPASGAVTTSSQADSTAVERAPAEELRSATGSARW